MTYTSACVVLIGNEILSGRTQDKNLNYMALKLSALGIKVRECRIIPDVEAEIIHCINEVRSKYDYVFTTGGIGPTHDDITTACIAKAFGVGLYENAEAVRGLKARVGVEISPATYKMATVPMGAALIQNPLTAAPGFVLGNVYVMAGIPDVMQAMLHTVLPTLKGGSSIYSDSVFCNLPESKLASGLTKIQQRYSELEIGSYPQWPASEYRLNLVARGHDAKAVAQATREIEQLVLSLDGEIIPSLASEAPRP